MQKTGGHRQNERGPEAPPQDAGECRNANRECQHARIEVALQGICAGLGDAMAERQQPSAAAAAHAEAPSARQ